MKALSLTQPWAELVVRGLKEYETRSWSTTHRGPLAIHASKGFPRWAQRLLDEGEPIGDALNMPPGELPRGAIVGTVVLIGCYSTTGLQAARSITPQEINFGDWGPGRYAWHFENPVQCKPASVKGALGLWAVPLEIQQALPQ